MRLVSFTRSYADGSHEPVRELVFLTLVEQEDGTWLSVTPSGTDRREECRLVRCAALTGSGEPLQFRMQFLPGVFGGPCKNRMISTI